MMLRFISILILLLVANVSFTQTFKEDLANETHEDFPSQWGLVKGSAYVSKINNKKVITFIDHSILKPIINNKTDNYLTDNFTIEFDAFFDNTVSFNKQMYEIRFWNGQANLKIENGHYDKFILFRHGIRSYGITPSSPSINLDNYLKSLESKDEAWRHIKIQYTSGKLKMYIDDNLLLNFPKLYFKPNMVSIGCLTRKAKVDMRSGITNISITGVKISSNTQTETTTSSSEIITPPLENPVGNTDDKTSIDSPPDIKNENTEENTNLNPIQSPTGEIITPTFDNDFYDAIDGTTTTTPISTNIVLPRILKITVTDLLCIEERDLGDNPDDYGFQLYTYFNGGRAKYDKGFTDFNNISCNTQVPGGNLLVCGDKNHQIHVEQGNTRIGNISASLMYKLENAHYTEKELELKFFIWLKEYTGNKDLVLFDGKIEIITHDVLNHLLKGKFPENSKLVQFYDTSITHLNDFYEYGPRGSYIWLRFTSRKSLEGPIKLGDSGHKAAAWVEFELID
ncbi:MAG: hypothetical protein ABJM36_00575 [Algibacter sp.]|uniref:hypothetical protein n=1 Tax=Algibacter sp. TaxID=1872428 RepID=UPI0032970F3F